MFHIVTNVETVETERFLVVIAFGPDGYLVDYCCPTYEGPAKAVEFVGYLLKAHGQSSARLWTSNTELYTAFLSVPGIGAEIKHPDDTAETKRMIDKDKKILIEFHEIKPQVPKPKLPAWRMWLFLFLEKLTEKVKGAEKYEI
jgi:hypothetical protein